MNKLLNDKSLSICHWTKLLNFYDQNRSELTLRQKKRLCKRIDELRVYWNTDREEEITITKPKGTQKRTIARKGLGINRKDIHPNIYAEFSDLAFLDENITTRILKAIKSCCTMVFQPVFATRL